MTKAWRTLVINPGSTSTKIGAFEGDKELFTKGIDHDASKLAEFTDISDQMPYRAGMISEALEENNLKLEDFDAFVGRGGGLLPLEGGVYAVDEVLLNDAHRGANGVTHPAQLGSQIANEFASKVGKPAFVVNPPDTDELCDCARMTGIKDVYRHVHLHALNLKETAIRHAAKLGKSYDECNFIVCHIGGGISISAHKQGKMIDGNDIVGGEGPMTPTRCGSLPIVEILDLIEAGKSTSEVRKLCLKSGGFVSLCDTSDAREVQAKAAQGDKAAARAWDTMTYQVCKWIGSMACVLEGKVDGILLGGGMVHSDDLVAAIEKSCSWIAPVSAYPGEFELEAMAAGACRVLDGVEESKKYTGKPAWSGFDD